jgi:hypothetical protein
LVPKLIRQSVAAVQVFCGTSAWKHEVDDDRQMIGSDVSTDPASANADRTGDEDMIDRDS